MIDRSVVCQGPAYLKALKALEPRVRLLPPLRDPGRLTQLAAELKPYGVDADWKILSKELIDRCHSLGILVFCDAMGEHETLKNYIQALGWGVDVIQTDYPARVLRVIELGASRGSFSRPDSISRSPHHSESSILREE